MVYKPTACPRRGAHAIEAAFVYPVLIFVIFAFIIGSTGVFYFDQVANLAREGARWASVHGATYASSYNSGTLITGSNVYTSAINPKMGGLNPAYLTVSVSWSDATGSLQGPTTMSDGATVYYADSTNNGCYQGTYYNTGTALQQNMVTVVVTYAWSPPLYLWPINLTSSSSQLMEY
jgi:Flp pilus assembly protein TadG